MSKATNTIWIYLDDDMKADLHKLANAERLSMSSYVRNLITKELNGGKWSY